MNQQGVLHCEVCDAELPNFNSMQWHIKGKRHQKALQHWKEKEENARLSIFVRNFPRATTEQELWSYFAQFGRVTKVSIVPPQNLFAIIEFSSEDTVQYVLSQTNHRINSQNIIVKPREVQMRGAPPTSKVRYQQFQRGPNLANMEPNRGPSLLAAGGYVSTSQGAGGFHAGAGHSGGGGWGAQEYGEYFPPQPRGKQLKAPNVEDQIDLYYHEELIEKLVQVKGVQNQLEWLCQNLQVTAEEAQLKFSLCEQLQTVLGKFFPGCTVNQFGSSVNGFGLSGCDMDIFLDLSTMHGRTWELQPVKLPFVRDFKFLKEKEWGPLIPADTNKMGLADQCKLICRILTEHLEGIKDAQVVPSNRCPLVRFKYGSGDIKCDLSLNNKLALQNTKLLYLYSVLNSRVRLLVYAIRYWAKVKQISGNNKASTKLSNYALTLMVMNYLQNVEPAVLPTIQSLSDLHGAANRTRIESWDCTFAMDWQMIPATTNTQSAAELLSGFFSYWSAFNFPENILLTRTAQEIPFTSFFDKSNMADPRLRNFKTSAVNIQDPFVLNHNITQNVNEKSREVIVREFRIAAIKTSVWGNDGFSMSSSTGGGDLIHLLNSEVPEIILIEDKEKEEAILEKGRMPRNIGEYEFEIELKPTMLTPKFLKILQKGTSGNVKLEWCKRVSAFILRVLKEVLMLAVEELPEATEEIKQKMKEEEAKMAAAKKHNEQILAKRAARRAEKRAELEAKMEAEKQEKEAGDKDEEMNAEEEEAEPQSKRPCPPSIFDLNLEPPKRFRGMYGPMRPPPPPEPSIDDLIEDSDDGEELIDYKMDEPELRYRRACEADVDKQFFMRAWCMTWARRKKVKNYLTTELGRSDEGMYMEKLISETIYQNDGAPLRYPVVGMYVWVWSVIDENDAKVVVEMECKEGKRDFNTFYQFTKIYIEKLMGKHLGEYHGKVE